MANQEGFNPVERSIDQEIGIGVARYERFKNESTKAEFAITIVDAYQNRGIGGTLLKLLIQTALKNGINTFIGFVLEENKPMLHLVKPYPIKMESEEGLLLRIEIDLTKVEDNKLIISDEISMKL